jgi:hypothetical protein
MSIPRKHRLLGAFVCAGLGALAVACTYGWTVGPAPIARNDGGSADGGLDAGPIVDAVADTSSDADAASAGDASVDAIDDAAASCASLEAQIVSVRAAAKQCTQIGVGQCAQQVTDECRCASYVSSVASSTAAASYISAVAAYLDAACPLPASCSTCVSGGTCLVLDGGPGAACYP